MKFTICVKYIDENKFTEHILQFVKITEFKRQILTNKIMESSTNFGIDINNLVGLHIV